mmetsp:Transcript_10684/g.39930  ORF Transcript_10684/g.39930 Transcript_10684/m.39930 type:complete len:224 (-) Transcript_10684:5040-5711(-)
MSHCRHMKRRQEKKTPLVRRSSLRPRQQQMPPVNINSLTPSRHSHQVNPLHFCPIILLLMDRFLRRKSHPLPLLVAEDRIRNRRHTHQHLHDPPTGMLTLQRPLPLDMHIPLTTRTNQHQSPLHPERNEDTEGKTLNIIMIGKEAPLFSRLYSRLHLLTPHLLIGTLSTPPPVEQPHHHQFVNSATILIAHSRGSTAQGKLQRNLHSVRCSRDQRQQPLRRLA